jgi:hypothetical protein
VYKPVSAVSTRRASRPRHSSTAQPRAWQGRPSSERAAVAARRTLPSSRPTSHSTSRCCDPEPVVCTTRGGGRMAAMAVRPHPARQSLADLPPIMGQRRGLVVDLLLLPSAAASMPMPAAPAACTKNQGHNKSAITIAGLAPAKLLQTRACYFSASRCSGCASTLRATGRQLGRGLLGSASRPCCPASCT